MSLPYFKQKLTIFLCKYPQMNGTVLSIETTPPAINITLLEEIDVNDYLVFKKESEDGPEVKGGNMDALIIHATKVQKNSDGEWNAI